MSGEWQIPENHPIDSEAKAREIIELTGVPCREFIASCCVPIFWWATNQPGCNVLANGTITLIQTPTKVLGVTADHVVAECLEAFEAGNVCVQVADTSAHDLKARVIARSAELDLATLEFGGLIERLGWPDKQPLRSWPLIPPQENRGIMIGGYPGIERRVDGPKEVNFGIFTALAVARTVSEDQISCLFEREFMIDSGPIQTLPPNTDLGGISGGPVITVCRVCRALRDLPAWRYRVRGP